MRLGLIAPVVVALAGTVGLATALALPGDLDPGFGNGGHLVSDVSQATDDRAHDVIVQPDGRILAIGFGQGLPEELVAARYLGDGTLDPSFGNGGKVALDIVTFGQGVVRRAALQPDGKIVGVGSATTGDFLVVRLTAGGGLDPTFDGDGVVMTDFGLPFSFSLDSAAAVAVQADGKIVVAGRVLNGFTSAFGVARYDQSGALDPTFDGDGRWVSAIGPDAGATAVAIHPAGRIVVAGSAGFAGPDRRFVVVFLDDSGGTQVGTSFVDLAGVDEATSVAVQSDGKVVVAGRSNDDFAVVRLGTLGGTDPTFDRDGSVLTTIAPGVAAIALDVAVQSNGKIIAAGATTTAGVQDFALARYTSEGSLDTAFGGDGIVTTDVGGGVFDRLGGIDIAPDGDIVAAGWTGTGCTAVGCFLNFGLARYEGDPPAVEVDIDVKPGSAENSIIAGTGALPVAILSTSAFDATTVNASSVCFGDANTASERDCTEMHGRGHVEDANGDGDADLVLHFDAAETGIEVGDTTACLTGRTNTGVAIQGCDVIRTL